MTLQNVIDKVIAAINYIRTRPVVRSKFHNFLEEMDSPYSTISYYTEIRWVSKAKVLEQFIVLSAELEMFMEEEGQDVSYFKDPDWMCDLAFLTDMSEHMRRLNKTLQGTNSLVCELYDKISGFQKNVQLYIQDLEQNRLGSFKNCQDFFTRYNVNPSKYIPRLQLLKQSMEERFADFSRSDVDLRIFSNPFSETI